MKNRGQVFNERKTFIEGDIGTCLRTLDNFEAIRYVKDMDTESEYIRITDYLGGKVYYDITGKSDADVFVDTAKIVLMSIDKNVAPPSGIITDEQKLRHVSTFFRLGGRSYVSSDF